MAVLVLLSGCSEKGTPAVPKKEVAPKAAPVAAPANPTLADARRGFVTKPGGEQPSADPVPVPPAEVFRLVKFPSPVGPLSAYVTPDPGDGQKHPAIVWLTGGDTNSIGELWQPAPRSHDETAAAYRTAGITLMFPSLRGGNDNPGRREGFLGEVDDVLAAAEFLAAQPYVDAKRIYLGGHSTGGTLALLVAETSPRFRAVFAFGAASDVRRYGNHFVYYQAGDPNEPKLRSPSYWLHSVRSPLFVIEGTRGNFMELRTLRSRSENPFIHFVEVQGMDHFGVLAPANDAIAAKILADTGVNTNITLADQDVQAKR